MDEQHQDDADGGALTAEAPQALDLKVQIDKTGACERHVTVTVAREDINRYLNDAYSEMMGTAAVPGFRPGRAPRKLVESRYRSEVADQVKGNLLMDSMEQVTREHELAAISEPDLDPQAVEIPEEGPLTFEFDLEVRPEFAVPQWKGLTIERPVREFNDDDVTARLKNLLAEHGRLVPHDGPAEVGDYIVTRLAFRHGDEELAHSDEEVIRIRPELSFRDGTIKKFDKLMKGVKAGDSKQTEVVVTADAPNESLRGQKVTAVFDIHEVKKLELPKINSALLERLGGYESEAELRDAVRDGLKRQLDYEQQRRAREQITAALTEAADWELPPALVQRQSQRELQRTVLELQRSGFSGEEIRASENELRQNSMESTRRALKEHFILERIAEDQEITDAPEDHDAEIALIASQSGESPRRVRAQIEKRGMQDALRNQIVERKVIERILGEAQFKDVTFELPAPRSTALERSVAGGDEVDIPDALPGGGEAAPLPTPPEYD